MNKTVNFWTLFGTLRSLEHLEYVKRTFGLLVRLLPKNTNAADIAPVAAASVNTQG